jgi:hypothetical protein
VKEPVIDCIYVLTHKYFDGKWRDTKGCPTLEPSGKQEERKTEKQLEKIGNQESG